MHCLIFCFFLSAQDDVSSRNINEFKRIQTVAVWKHKTLNILSRLMFTFVSFFFLHQNFLFYLLSKREFIRLCYVMMLWKADTSFLTFNVLLSMTTVCTIVFLHCNPRFSYLRFLSWSEIWNCGPYISMALKIFQFCCKINYTVCELKRKDRSAMFFY